MWKLEVNAQKTKIVIFSKGKTRRAPVFTFNGSVLEVVSNFSYLGVVFNFNGKFSCCKRQLYNQAQKTMYAVLRKCRKMDLPIDIQLELFHRTVIPILMYGAEVWGYKDNGVIEKLHLMFLRLALNVNSSTPRCMLYGEVGTSPPTMYYRPKNCKLLVPSCHS